MIRMPGHYNIAFLVLMLITLTFAPAFASQVGDLLDKQNPRAYRSFYRPTSAWTGVLELPQPDRRDSFGGVWIHITQAPDPSLIGRKLLLRWDISKPRDRWFIEHRRDVNFDQKRLAWAKKVGYAPPEILDGWKQVSPLESLPANRPGELHVMLKNPRLEGNTLFIVSEPVEVAGPEMALVRFVGPISPRLRTVQHFNPSSGQFDGPREVVAIQEENYGDPFFAAMPNTTVKGIEGSQLNDDGWYLYGRRRKGVFTVDALEPRSLLQLQPGKVVLGTKEAIKHLCRDEYRDLHPQTSAITVLEPNEERLSDPAKGSYYVEHQWPLGRKALVIHLFYGWQNDALKIKAGHIGPWATGHFSVGVAEVVRDPFTGERRFDIEFYQIYGHNKQYILSNTQKWHTYMGSMARGCMFTRPSANTLIRLPELDPYKIDDWEINPWKGLARQFEKMMALYRVGSGTGISEILSDTSCVQDSCATLYSAMELIRGEINRASLAGKWGDPAALGSGPRAAQIKRAWQLFSLCQDVEKALTFPGIKPVRWREFIKNPLATRTPGYIKRLGATLTALRSVFPRDPRDQLMKVAARRKCPMWSILSIQIGGLIEGLRPMIPGSPTSFSP